MTVSALDIAPTVRVVRRSGFTIAADGSYAACLAETGTEAEIHDDAGAAGDTTGHATGDGGTGSRFAERWTLDGPQPYAVPLPAEQPEQPGTPVVPLPDGRVLVARRAADHCDLALLYPAGAGTGELPLGSLPAADVTLLPPAPAGSPLAALVHDGGSTTSLWQVGRDAARRLVTVDGRCTGGVWLDRGGRLLAVDQELDGRTKAVAVDLHTGRTSPLLQLTDHSDDRLLLAAPDSGLLLLRSDATGDARLGWGVLGSRHPVRFPDALHLDGIRFTPVAAQPGQILTPEATVVALHAQAPDGTASLVLWRPGERRLHWRPAPPGWLGPAGLWLPGQELHLPYAVPDWPCGLVPYDSPPAEPPAEPPARIAPPPARPRRPLAVLPLHQAPLADASTAG